MGTRACDAVVMTALCRTGIDFSPGQAHFKKRIGFSPVCPGNSKYDFSRLRDMEFFS